LITIFIGLLGGILLVGMALEGNWGAFGLCAFILLFLWLCASDERKDWKAYQNRRDYWAMNGADRARARKRWQDEAKMQDMRMRAAAEERRAARMRKEMSESQRDESESTVRCFVCDNCHKAVWNAGHFCLVGGKPAMVYYCPECGKCVMIVR